jgi:hypothetical protein
MLKATTWVPRVFPAFLALPILRSFKKRKSSKKNALKEGRDTLPRARDLDTK